MSMQEKKTPCSVALLAHVCANRGEPHLCIHNTLKIRTHFPLGVCSDLSLVQPKYKPPSGGYAAWWFALKMKGINIVF